MNRQITDLEKASLPMGKGQRGPVSEPASTAKAQSSRLGCPPIFVMNPYYSGIGIARSLHGCGVQVFALTSEREAPGGRSRYFKNVYFVPNGRDEPEQLCLRLLEIAAEHGHGDKPVIFPTRDFDVLFLHDYREALGPHYLLPQSGDSPIIRMMDKFELAAVAGQLGIATPRTVTCGSTADIERQAPTLRFPVIVKPRFAYQWRRSGLWETVGAQKAIIVETASELRTLYQRLADVAQEVLLQEYIPGGDSDIVVCCCYIGREGELAGHFTARKLCQNPPLIGTGSVVEATEVVPVIAPSVELLKAFGYSGLAEIEYKYDRTKETYFLIEINPRHWDQHELGLLVGVNLTWLAYADMVGFRPSGVVPSYAPGSRYKWIAEGELLWGIVRKLWLELASLSGSEHPFMERFRVIKKTYAEASRLLQGKKIFGICRLKDPVPGIFLCLSLMRDAFRVLRSSTGGKTANERTTP
jgi:D-aspartate ligase